jgi:hypothetical protein
MKIYREIPLTELRNYREIPLTEFEFWGGGKDRVDYLTEEELNQIEQILAHLYPEGLSEGALNDFFWFEDATIAEWLGYESFAQIMERDE